MCYSFRSSVGTFFIAMITVYFMYLRQTSIDKYIAPLIFVYGFMQFAEAMMWYDRKCDNINILGTYFAYIILILHVLAIGVGIYLVEKRLIGIILGLLIFLYYLVKIPKMKCSKKINNHMFWGFPTDFYNKIFIMCVFLVLFLSNMTIKYKIILILWYLISWLYFFKKYYSIMDYFNGYDKNRISSLWCHIASLSAPGIYLIQKFIKP